jgi:hypothetical protein
MAGSKLILSNLITIEDTPLFGIICSVYIPAFVNIINLLKKCNKKNINIIRKYQY